MSACVREMNRTEEHGRVNWEMQIKPGPAQIEPEKAYDWACLLWAKVKSSWAWAKRKKDKAET